MTSLSLRFQICKMGGVTPARVAVRLCPCSIRRDARAQLAPDEPDSLQLPFRPPASRESREPDGQGHYPSRVGDVQLCRGLGKPPCLFSATFPVVLSRSLRTRLGGGHFQGNLQVGKAEPPPSSARVKLSPGPGQTLQNPAHSLDLEQGGPRERGCSNHCLP